MQITLHFLRRSAQMFPILLLLSGCENKHTSKPGPEDALATFELEPGFKIELVAAEPLISDPVDMEIDEYGRLFVVEMHGYPLDKSGTGVIKLISDTNGDGRMDKSVVFAKGLVLPNSIMRWKKGLLVTDAPNVLYFEDTNGDGQADVRDTVLTGFALSNPQHNLNSPLLGIDNWIYLAHEGAVATQTYEKEFGDPGHDIYFPTQPKAPRLSVNADGRSVRFRPDHHELELSSSNTQFGHTFDAWGHRFLVHNADHVIEEVIAQTYLKRNPDLLISDASQSLSDHGDAAEVFPITQNPQHQILTDVGVITSACGITAYTGGAFKPPYDDHITFVAEPVSNLVHVDILKDDGASFKASRVLEHKEFLASRDYKFRPVNMYIGPDGALYVVDYYRQIIEHPEWMSDDVVKSGELYNDSDKGRIYRISSTDAKPAEWTKGLTLGDASIDQLIEKLASPNSWWRLNAQRLLIDKNNKEAVPGLIQMTKNTSPMGRLHGLWTLEGMQELKPEIIQEALKDRMAGIRENAIKLAELHLSRSPDLAKLLLSMHSDSDAKVRFQLLCTLGFINTPESDQIRNQILFKDIRDPWVRVAALAATSQPLPLLKEVLEKYQQDAPAYASLLEQLTRMIGVRGDPKEIRGLIQKATDLKTGNQVAWPAAILEGLSDAMNSRKSKTTGFESEQNLLIKTFFEHPSSQVRRASLRLLKVMGIENELIAKAAITKAVSIADDVHQTEGIRAEAIDFISLRNPSPYSSFLMKLFVPTKELSIQLAALRTLSAIPDTTICHYIVAQWPVLTPEIRDAGVSTFLVNDSRITLLLNALASGKIQPANIAWPRQVRLMAQRNEPLRARARAIFTKNNDQEVNKSYQQALKLTGNAVEGKAVFQKNCAICHQIRGAMGVPLGPDLGTIHNWSTDAIMSNILAPNQSISSGFDLWSVELKTGETIQGIIATETPVAITLRNAGSVEKTISRSDIKSLKALNMSAMTNGLDKQINQQEMADLLAFLKSNK